MHRTTIGAWGGWCWMWTHRVEGRDGGKLLHLPSSKSPSVGATCCAASPTRVLVFVVWISSCLPWDLLQQTDHARAWRNTLQPCEDLLCVRKKLSGFFVQTSFLAKQRRHQKGSLQAARRLITTAIVSVDQAHHQIGKREVGRKSRTTTICLYSRCKEMTRADNPHYSMMVQWWRLVVTHRKGQACGFIFQK